MSAALSRTTDSFTDASQTVPVAADRERELWIGLPKGGKTLGGSDDRFLAFAGLQPEGRQPRIDDYTLHAVEGAPGLGIRVFEEKPGDAVENISDGLLDAAIVGLDVMREFNLATRGQKGRMQAVKLVNLDLAPCALAMAVQERSGIASVQDMAGKTVVTKYPAAVESWASKNGITLGRIIKRNGGIESYGLLIKDAVIADMVESGASLAANGWRILGMDEASWQSIKSGERKFSDLSMEAMDAIPGVIVASRAVLVRSPRAMSAAKEAALASMAAAFKLASQALGRAPVTLDKKVASQGDYPGFKRSRNRSAGKRDPDMTFPGHLAARQTL